MAHQYNFDAETTLGFIDHHGLIDQFSLNLEANHGTLAGHSGEHEVEAAVARGKLGSLDAKVRRESTNVEDLFIGHINGMDNYARGLKSAAALIKDGTFDSMVASRYAGFETTDLGRKFA